VLGAAALAVVILTAGRGQTIGAATAQAQTGAPTDQCTGPGAGDAGPCRPRGGGGTYERPQREPRAPTARERATEVFNAGAGHFRNGRYEDAAAAFERAVEIDRYYTLAWEWLARALDRQAAIEEALRAANMWKLQADGSGQAHLFWGHLLFRYAGDTWERRIREQRYEELATNLDDAESAFARARALGVTREQVRYIESTLAEIRRGRARLEPLVAEQRRTRQAYRDAHAANARGLELLDAGDTDGAIRELERARALRPEEPAFTQNLANARNEKGRALFTAKDHAGALEEFTRARELAPDVSAYTKNVALAQNRIAYREGAARVERGDYEGALATFDRLLQDDPSNAALADVVARVRRLRDEQLAREDDQRKAGQALEQVRPSLRAAVLRLGDALAQAESARAHGERAVVAPRDETAKHEASKPWDTGERVSAAGNAGAPGRVWTPEPRDRETPQMTEARTKAEHARSEHARYEAALAQEHAKPESERDLVRMSELKQKRSRAEYEEKLAQREYDEYRDRSARKPARADTGPPPGFK
jgi:tetratricopeptide (TPR) repeat protein